MDCHLFNSPIECCDSCHEAAEFGYDCCEVEYYGRTYSVCCRLPREDLRLKPDPRRERIAVALFEESNRHGDPLFFNELGPDNKLWWYLKADAVIAVLED